MKKYFVSFWLTVSYGETSESCISNIVVENTKEIKTLEDIKSLELLIVEDKKKVHYQATLLAVNIVNFQELPN